MSEYVMEVLSQRFASGNDTPVTRAHITREEFEQLAAAPTPSAGEAVWMFKTRQGDWRTFINERHRIDTIASGDWEVREFHTAPQLAAIQARRQEGGE